MRGKTGPKILLIIISLMLLTGVLSGCSGLSFIPGASYGYYIWEDGGRINISWSIDRKDATFSGSLITDGDIVDIRTVAWEEGDVYTPAQDGFSFTSTLGVEDYMDGLVLEVREYGYIEFDLKINEGYDLSRVHVGAFLNNPENSPFRIGPHYFDDIRDVPWYEKHPFSGFFYKLYANKYFTFLFLLIIGAVIIELLRITAFSGKRYKKLYTGISYLVLLCLVAVIYFVLRYFIV